MVVEGAGVVALEVELSPPDWTAGLVDSVDAGGADMAHFPYRYYPLISISKGLKRMGDVRGGPCVWGLGIGDWDQMYDAGGPCNEKVPAGEVKRFRKKGFP